MFGIWTPADEVHFRAAMGDARLLLVGPKIDLPTRIHARVSGKVGVAVDEAAAAAVTDAASKIRAARIDGR